MDIFRQHLKELSVIRAILLGVLWSVWIASWMISDVGHFGTGIILFLLSTLTLLSAIRCKNAEPVTEQEFFIQLLIDVFGFIGLFYFSGGANNPFVSYLLVPISLAAATLQWRFVAVIATLSMCSYAVLLFYFVDLPIFSPEHAHHSQPWSWHILGMWINFFISASLMSYFLLRMSKSLRIQNNLLQTMREAELRNEQLTAVALLAAGAAHELNTPLSTMKIVLTDMRSQLESHPPNTKNQVDSSAQHPIDWRSELHLLEQQLNHCASILKQLVRDATGATQGEYKEQTIEAFNRAVLDRWQLLRPQAKFSLAFDGEGFQRNVKVDPRLQQAMINLFNNAADAADQQIEIRLSCEGGYLVCKIIDQGQGIDKRLATDLGKKPQTTKDQGLGIGLVLTHATINACGGSVEQMSLQPYGTLTQMRVPL